jgi:hypothetical protein
VSAQLLQLFDKRKILTAETRPTNGCKETYQVADLHVSAQLLQLLDSVFLRNTLEQRLIKGSEVEHVGVMELIRGLFETDPVAVQQGRYSRRLQQPQLISMVVRMLVGLPSYAHSLTHAHRGHARYVCVMYICIYVSGSA